MRIFDEPNISGGWKCPICNTDKVGKIVLIGVAGTEDDNNMEAEQFHLDCLCLTYNKKYDVILQHLERESKA